MKNRLTIEEIEKYTAAEDVRRWNEQVEASWARFFGRKTK